MAFSALHFSLDRKAVDVKNAGKIRRCFGADVILCPSQLVIDMRPTCLNHRSIVNNHYLKPRSAQKRLGSPTLRLSSNRIYMKLLHHRDPRRAMLAS